MQKVYGPIRGFGRALLRIKRARQQAKLLSCKASWTKLLLNIGLGLPF